MEGPLTLLPLGQGRRSRKGGGSRFRNTARSSIPAGVRNAGYRGGMIATTTGFDTLAYARCLKAVGVAEASATPCAGSKGVRAVRRTPAMNPRAAPGTASGGSESFQGGPAYSRITPLTLRRASSKVMLANTRKARSVGPPAEYNSPTPARVWPPEPG